MRPVTRPVVWCIALLALYGTMAMLNDPAGTMGTDEGAKVATLVVMTERGSYQPDVGYWASAWDPDAVYHGLAYTERFGDTYVNVTTLPMILAARPLWALGGYRAALLVPMLCGVATALAARALGRRLVVSGRPGGRDRAGAVAFWSVGLLSPVAVYAVDLWEHTPGLACMAWAVVLLVDAVGLRAMPSTGSAASNEPEVQRPPADADAGDGARDGGRSRSWSGPALRAGGAGLLFGVGASMRTESILYFVTTVGIAGLAAGFPRRWLRPAVLGVAAVAGFAVAAVANTLLELAVLGRASRAGRANYAVTNGGQDLGFRLQEGLTTLLSPWPSTDLVYSLAGLALAAAMGVWALAVAGRVPARARPVAIVVVIAVLVLRVADGAGFWPGLAATTPLAGVGLFTAWKVPARRWVAAFALLALPLVVVFQFSGGALPQWGGRYVLLTGFLLGVLGAVAVSELPGRQGLALLGPGLVVTLIAGSWMVTRTHDIADAGAALAARPEQVLVSPEGFPPREFGATWGTKDWLATLGRLDVPGHVPNGHDDLPAAVDVIRRSGATTFAIVVIDTSHPLPSFAGFHETGRTTVPYVGDVDFTVVSFRRDG